MYFISVDLTLSSIATALCVFIELSFRDPVDTSFICIHNVTKIDNSV